VITLHLCYYNTELSPLDFTSPSTTASQKWSGNEGEGDDAKHEMGNGMHTDPPPSLEDIALEMYGGSDNDLAHGGVRESREKKVHVRDREDCHVVGQRSCSWLDMFPRGNWARSSI
jgi:hypothetical protein